VEENGADKKDEKRLVLEQLPDLGGFLLFPAGQNEGKKARRRAPIANAMTPPATSERFARMRSMSAPAGV
jgi:hypothetical protein